MERERQIERSISFGRSLRQVVGRARVLKTSHFTLTRDELISPRDNVCPSASQMENASFSPFSRGTSDYLSSFLSLFFFLLNRLERKRKTYFHFEETRRIAL